MITFDKDRIYTWGRLQRYFKWSEEYVYHLHAKDYDYQDQWSVMLPILVRAMVASDDRLFVLGPKELMRQDEIKRRITEEEVQQLMAEQEKALDGESGSILLTVDKQSGKILSGYRLQIARRCWTAWPVLTATCTSPPPMGNSAASATTARVWMHCPAEEVEELNENGDAPVAPEESKQGEEASRPRKDDSSFRPRMPISPTSMQAHAYQTELGYRIASEAKQGGVGLEAARYAADRQSHLEVQAAVRQWRRRQQRLPRLRGQHE